MFNQHLFLLASFLTGRLITASCIHGTSLFPRAELPGGTVAVSKFGYTGLQGPLNWANLSPDNEKCSTGSTQSPINIDNTTAILASKVPKVVIPNVEAAEFENLGSTIEVVVNGTTTFAGKDFSLKQFHFHTPSEHRIAEEYFPLEVHMVHEAADGSGSIAVIALTFQLSEDGTTSTELVDAVIENLEEIKTPGTVTETAALNFTDVIDHIQTTPLFQYTGSLTTPPCAEGVTFLVAKEPLPLSVKTYNAIKSVVKFNSRYSQNTPGKQNLLQLGRVAGSVNSTKTAHAAAPPPADLVAIVAPPPNHAVVKPSSAAPSDAAASTSEATATPAARLARRNF
ncbi:hypothetical protein RUND412_003774 [Rhizina undulata]